jgi:hypothetical protein
MYNLDHIWSKSEAWQSLPMRGTLLGHIRSKSAVWQSPPMRGTFLDHIWSKSTVWQSPPMRGIILGHIWSKSAVWQVLQWGAYFCATFVLSLLHEKVSVEIHIPYRLLLVKVRSTTKASEEGQSILLLIIPLKMGHKNQLNNKVQRSKSSLFSCQVRCQECMGYT